MVQKVLGKGLEALIPIRTKEDEKLIGGDGQLVFLPMDKIRPGKYQPRLEMKTDEIKELANSIKEKGIIQPIVVRKLNDDDHYEIVAGGRRHMAAKSLAMKEMPVIIKELSDQDALIF
ncbi:MAG: ParB/RepB/Spo0J family partition protein, partial [Candidatus Omnitrophica bacterium]|nr:ParB/RepB/Spo0J family partition protein [Candidatus Omnitrophota bacterium]